MALLLDPHLARHWYNASRLSQSLRAVAVAPAGGHAGRELDERHTVPTLMVCLQGVVRVELSRGAHDLNADEALLLPPGVPHRHAALRPGSAAVGMGFMLDLADIEIFWSTSEWVLTIPEQPARGLVEAACSAGPSERLRLVRGAWAGLAEEHARPLAPMPEPTRRMWMFLRRERLSPISTRDVLRASGLAPTRAKELFTAWFGMTPLRLLRRHRLEYARHLLAGGASVAEAASASGFRSRRHFTATCQTVHGAPPTRLR